MIASIIPQVDDLHADQLVNRTVVMIDAFRASSCMVTALANGALFIIPAETVSKARELATAGMLTGGERFGKSLERSTLEIHQRITPQTELKKGNCHDHYLMEPCALSEKANRASEIRVGCLFECLHMCKNHPGCTGTSLFLCAGTLGSFSMEDGMAAGSSSTISWK